MNISEKIDYVENNLNKINPNRCYVRVKFEYKSLDGWNVYADKINVFNGVMSIYDGNIIFKKTFSSSRYLGLNQIQIQTIEFKPFNKDDLKRCWNTTNDFLCILNNHTKAL